jgi:hypothetical protein
MMSRKVILSLVAAGTIAAASFACDTTYARGFAGGGFGGHFVGGHRFAGGGHFAQHRGRLIPILNPGHSGHPGHPVHWVWHHHDHGHWVFRDGVWIDIDAAADETPVIQPAAGLCTCLTKTYTPDGLVVFADVCTKEAASAPVDQSADAAQAPTSGATQGPSVSAMQASTIDAAKVATTDVAKVPTSPNYAGRTYADYLAATQQAASQPAPKN